MLVICGALEVGEMSTTRFGMATDCASGIVALDAISPMITSTLFALTSFVAASTEAAACVCPSSEATSRTEILFESLSRFSEAFWSPAARSAAIAAALGHFIIALLRPRFARGAQEPRLCSARARHAPFRPARDGRANRGPLRLRPRDRRLL